VTSRPFPVSVDNLDESVANLHIDVLKTKRIVVSVSDVEREVEAGSDRPTRLLHETDIHDLQDIVVGRIPCSQATGSAAVAAGAGRSVQIDGAARQPIGALHDLDTLDLICLVTVGVVVLFDNQQGIVIIERELGVVGRGNVGIPLDQVRILDVDRPCYFIAVRVLQVEDQDQIFRGADAVGLI